MKARFVWIGRWLGGRLPQSPGIRETFPLQSPGPVVQEAPISKIAFLKKVEVSNATVLLAVAALFTLLYNATFWRQVFEAYAPSTGNLAFLVSVGLCLFAFTSLFLMLFDFPYVFKPSLVLLVLCASTTAYFMDTYQVIIDSAMLQNAFLTDAGEVRDLLTLKFFAYLLILGALPSALIVFIKIKRKPTFQARLVSKLKLVGLLLASMAIALFLFNKNWASFLREHKPIRKYANPDYLAYSVVKFASAKLSVQTGPVQPLGLDARIQQPDSGRELIIMVIGESARADRFSLNGYPRETNPLLARKDVISFTSMYSEGTSTANAVPCMFSTLDHDTYSERKARSSENLLDVLRHAGVNVLWRDNNSDSKGVADRVTYEDFKSSARNPPVEGEPRDEGMLVGLQDYIDRQKTGSVFIVLHQMGNHGPAYYKRYPAAFERFTPVCRTNELGKCSTQEIDNAYDNAILYTDHFLAQVIKLLEQNAGTFQAAMLYSSDHGESLGEKGLYLHGMPYIMAPEVQKHVATVFWFADTFRIDTNRFRQASGLKLTHSTLFHTILGLMGIQTSVYDPSRDIARLSDPSSPALAKSSTPSHSDKSHP